MAHEKKALVFSIERGALNDGPGLRTTVFLKGCPLRCVWCHNPESQSAKVQVFGLKGETPEEINKMQGELMVNRQYEVKNPSAGSPTPTCSNMLKTSGKWYTVDELLELVMQDKAYYASSGGGVTFSGGEPLQQADFLSIILSALSRKGIHTCVDTSGFASSKAVKKVLPHTRLFLFDVKHYDEELHVHYTGQPLQPVLDNLALIDAHNVPVHLRIPLIKNVNCHDSFLQFIKQLKHKHRCISQIDILPYHADWRGKPEAVLQKNSMADLQTPEPDLVAAWEKELNRVGANSTKEGGDFLILP